MRAAVYHAKVEPILHKLDGISDWWSLFSILTGGVLAIWLAVASLMAAVIADVVFQFQSTARTVVIVAWALFAAGALLYLLVRPLRRQRTRAAAARRLEDVFPELGSDLINLVQLSQGNGTTSAFLRDLALSQAASHAVSVPLDTAADTLAWRRRTESCMNTPRDLVVALLIALGLVGAGGVLHKAFPAWPRSVYRLFHPSEFLPAQGAAVIAEVTPGDVDLVSGAQLTIVARLDNPSAMEYEGVLFATAADGSEQRYSMTANDASDQFRFAFSSVTASLRYRLEIGGTQTRVYFANVFTRPEIHAIAATYRYPKYTGQEDATVELKGGALEAPQFTVADLKITTSAPMKSAHLMHGAQRIEADCDPLSPRVTARLALLESGSYTIHLTDERGAGNADSPRNPIRVTVDAAPTVELSKPATELLAAAGETVAFELNAADDHALTLAELRTRTEAESPQPEQVIQTWNKFRDAKKARLLFDWKLPKDLKPGTVIACRARAVDNRRAQSGETKFEPQEATLAVRTIRIVDSQSRYQEKLQSLEQFRQELWRIYRRQTLARVDAAPLATAAFSATSKQTADRLVNEQKEIKSATARLAESIQANNQTLAPFKTLLAALAARRMTEAIDLAGQVAAAAAAKALHPSASKLVHAQDDVLEVLRKLLDVARAEEAKTLAQLDRRPGGDLANDAKTQLQNLHDKLKEFTKQQRKVIEASEELAKRSVEDFSADEQQKLKDLAAAQDDWSRFFNEKSTDLSRLPEQDFSNPSLLKELIEVQTELKMAADALTQRAMDIAVPLEELGAEMAQEMTTNIEKWLPDTPDRERWSQEEPMTDAMRQAPMAELPQELEDLVGELMEEEEDLMNELEDMSSSWADSIDKGAGWDAMDGPISNMSAKGVTGNRLPNTNEIGGRSGEGRSGRSSGEFVGDSAVGKGGRKTPSRLTPDPFEKGQVKDTSKDAVGGATGGGKESGQGGEGIEGPVPPAMKRQLERLAGKQGTLRNKAETIRLQFKITNYNTASLDELLAQMRRVEQQLRSGSYRTVMRTRDVVLGKLGDVRRQAGGEIAVKKEASQNVPQEIRKTILGSMSEPSPEGWDAVNKSYFEKIAQGK